MISNTLHLLGYQWGKYGENPLWSMNDKASIYAWYHSSRRGRGVLWHLYHIAADTDDRNTNLMFYSPRQVLDSLFHHLHHKCQSKSVSLSEIHVPGGRVSVVLSWYTVVDRQNIQGIIELRDEENLFPQQSGTEADSTSVSKGGWVRIQLIHMAKLPFIFFLFLLSCCHHICRLNSCVKRQQKPQVTWWKNRC